MTHPFLERVRAIRARAAASASAASASAAPAEAPTLDEEEPLVQAAADEESYDQEIERWHRGDDDASRRTARIRAAKLAKKTVAAMPLLRGEFDALLTLLAVVLVDGAAALCDTAQQRFGLSSTEAAMLRELQKRIERAHENAGKDELRRASARWPGSPFNFSNRRT